MAGYGDKYLAEQIRQLIARSDPCSREVAQAHEVCRRARWYRSRGIPQRAPRLRRHLLHDIRSAILALGKETETDAPDLHHLPT